MEKEGKYPAIIHTKTERNARLYQHLLSMGLVVSPVFKKGSSDIVHMYVSTSPESEPRVTEEFIPFDSVNSPMNSPEVTKNCFTTQDHGDNVINFPTKS
jgi:hypothetical protein